MSKKAVILIIPFFLSCAHPPLATEYRNIVFVEQTKATKKQAYDRVLAHLAKSIGDSNKAIKMQDQESGRIVAKFRIDCDKLPRDWTTASTSIYYNVEIETKDNKARMTFQPLEVTSVGKLASGIITRELREGDADGVKVCTEQEKKGFLSVINGAEKSENW